MMIFRTPLDIRCYKAGEFVVLADFLVDFSLRDGRYRLAIPRGFITDFASVPKAVQILPGFDVNGDSRDAAVVHDFAYSSNGSLMVRDFLTREIIQIDLSRKECDDLFFDGLVSSGYSESVANIFYAGVRAGGWYYWRKRSNGLQGNYDFVPENYWSTAQ